MCEAKHASTEIVSIAGITEEAYANFYCAKRGSDSVWEVPLVLETMSDAVETSVPLPLPYRRINDDILEYFEDMAKSLPKKAQGRIVVYLPIERITPGLQEKVNKVLAIYEKSWHVRLRREEKAALRQVFSSVFWGFVFMLGCQVVRYFADFPDYPTITNTISEGMLVLGWVALWNPYDQLLFSWRPAVRRRELHERIAMFPVVLRPIPATVADWMAGADMGSE